jgi:hypothetical protein
VTFENSVFLRPAFFLENVLDADQLASVRSDMEADGVGQSCFRKVIATAAAVAEIADLPLPRFIRLECGIGRAALARVGVSQRQSRWHHPAA